MLLRQVQSSGRERGSRVPGFVNAPGKTAFGCCCGGHRAHVRKREGSLSKTASTPIPPRAGTVTVSSRARRRSDFNRLVESMCCSNVPLLTSAWRHRHQHVLASRPRNHRVSAASPLSTSCCRCRLNAGNCGLKLPLPPFFGGNGRKQRLPHKLQPAPRCW